MAYAARRSLHLEHLSLPRFAISISTRQVLLCLLVPGFSFYHAGWPRIAAAFAGAWVVAGLVFLLWLGHTAASIAFGLMMSVHVSSVLHFLNRVAPSSSVWRRLALSLLVLFVMGQLIYRTGLDWFQNHLFMPLDVNGKIYVINPRVRPAALHAGDWLAFHLDSTVGHGGVRIREGYVLDRVLAGPGDVVEFSRESVLINGTAHTPLPFMPSRGARTMAEKTWLVWPSLRTVQRNNVSQDDIASTVLQMAQVHHEQMIGKPYRRWFWRDQTK